MTAPKIEISVDQHVDVSAVQELMTATGSPYGQADPRWLGAIAQGLAYKQYVIRAKSKNEVCGVLPLAYMKSAIFGKHLVSLPYVNTGGVIANDPHVCRALVDEAVQLADRLDVKHLQLRHEAEVQHDRLTETLTSKVHMRLVLPEDPDKLWQNLTAKVRNQVRKGEKHELTVEWGRDDKLHDFYQVFARNMRDLGTPVFGRRLFRSILNGFGQDAEFCIAYHENNPIAAGLLVHSKGMTEVPSASSLREHNKKNANMLMYWHLLKRTIERGQPVFDFGRSTEGSNTYRFKKQWGAAPHPAIWQYYVRKGSVGETRPDSGKVRQSH